jgi:hypothetical protein
MCNEWDVQPALGQKRSSARGEVIDEVLVTGFIAGELLCWTHE